MKKIKPSEGNKTFCMAPWTHTYLSPQTERRMCCASREPAQSFKQYIDTGNSSNKYKPLSLKEHWNSDHMKSVRLRMMAGEELPECEVCDHKLLNTDVYRSYWNKIFQNKNGIMLIDPKGEKYICGKPNEKKPLNNKAIAGLYPPGSTIKIIVQDLTKQLENNKEFEKDLELLNSQVIRCNEILKRLSLNPV